MCPNDLFIELNYITIILPTNYGKCESDLLTSFVQNMTMKVKTLVYCGHDKAEPKS